MNLTAKIALTDEQFSDLTKHIKHFEQSCRTIMHKEYQKAKRVYGTSEIKDTYYLNITPVKHSPDSYYELVAEYTIQ